MTDEEIDLLRAKPLDQLSDDELEFLADRGLRILSEQQAADYEYSQRLALSHLRSVLRQCISDD